MYPLIYNHDILYGGLGLGYTISKVLDRGIIELVGPYGLATGLTFLSRDIAKLDIRNMTSYALDLALALVTITLLLLSPVLFGNQITDVRLLLILVAALIFVPPKSTYNKDESPLFQASPKGDMHQTYISGRATTSQYDFIRSETLWLIILLFACTIFMGDAVFCTEENEKGTEE